MNRKDLDKKIEHWLADQWQCRVDFEINDALNKLPALKLVNETDGRLSVVPIQQGIKNLELSVLEIPCNRCRIRSSTGFDRGIQ